jgi:uncharacterized protein YjiS (DUF1127 family)
MTTGNRGSGMFGGFAVWWRNLRAGRVGLDELQNCGDEAAHVARDVGLTRHDLYTVAAKRPDAADQLAQRVEALHIDRAAVLHADPMVVRDLERVCTVCGSKRRCDRDLARHPDDPVWRTYCPNVQTLEALETESKRGDAK